MMFYCKRKGEMYFKGKATARNNRILKALVSKKGRENVSLGRELFGNGILLKNIIMKHFLDMGLFTYQEIYYINMLVAGKENTGVNAFR